MGRHIRYIILFTCSLLICHSISATSPRNGAEQTEKYLPLLSGKRVALVANHTSMIGNIHLLDTLHTLGVNLKGVFVPEHGFRGTADAGEIVRDGKDVRTGVPIYSLYGQTKKPQDSQLENIDIVIFDMQDVGARFYTYISTLYYVIQACAENDKPLIVLDRPNPCDTIDGPVLQHRYKSFVGMLPIPVLHGCTIGEIARMITGEKWTGKHHHCQLTVIPVEGWKHGQPYSLPVKPSPNLPNDISVALYPSLCPFEGTAISVGRGTTTPFQVIGSPDIHIFSFRFMPKSLPGFDKNPLYKNKYCYGLNLQEEGKRIKGFTLKYVIQFYDLYRSTQKDAEKKFFTRPQWFDLLMGTSHVQRDIIHGKCEEEIRESWQEELKEYRNVRKNYLLYPDYK